MGNDLTSDEKFMSQYEKQVKDFSKQPPLYDSEDIQFPLSTKGVKIVDAKGKRVKLVGGNWSGGHLCRQCVDGLQCRPLRQIACDIKNRFRMNCVRLTYSLQLYFDNSIIKEKYLKANPQLIGKTAMEIFDFTINTLTEVGLMVILNNHTSTSQWCCSNEDGDGLWWSYKYPENMFFQCAEAFAQRYKHNPLVIGMDLRNQLRKANGLEATWGDNNPLTDWHRAATICAEKVLKIAPHWLIIVGGLNYQLDLTPILEHPLKLSVENKLVYSGHLYSFSWPPSWANFSYDAFKKKLFNSQFFVRGLGYPILLGEFGNNKRDGLWNYLIKYLNQTDVDWTYWPLDGFKCEPNDPQKDQTYGIFTNDFQDIRNPEIFSDLETIGAPKSSRLSKSRKISLTKQLSQKRKLVEQEKILRTVASSKIKQSSQKKQEKTIQQVESVKQFVLKEQLGILQLKQKEHSALSIPSFFSKSKSQKYEQMAYQEIKAEEIKTRFSEEISIEQILSKVNNLPRSQIKGEKEQIHQIKLLPNQVKAQDQPKEQRPVKKKFKIFQQKIQN